MNKHILLIMKWLQDPESVSHEELKNNVVATFAAAVAADWAAARAAGACYVAEAQYAYANAEYAACVANAACWVDKYFKETGEDKQAYIDAISK